MFVNDQKYKYCAFYKHLLKACAPNMKIDF